MDLDIQTHTVEDLVYSALEKEIAKGSPIEIDLPQGLPPVSADAGLIRPVLREIATNALKYSQQDAPIGVRARAADTGVVISVIDRGPGIPAEEQRLIFEKYDRGSRCAAI